MSIIVWMNSFPLRFLSRFFSTIRTFPVVLSHTDFTQTIHFVYESCIILEHTVIKQRNQKILIRIFYY